MKHGNYSRLAVVTIQFRFQQGRLQENRCCGVSSASSHILGKKNDCEPPDLLRATAFPNSPQSYQIPSHSNHIPTKSPPTSNHILTKNDQTCAKQSKAMQCEAKQSKANLRHRPPFWVILVMLCRFAHCWSCLVIVWSNKRNI